MTLCILPQIRFQLESFRSKLVFDDVGVTYMYSPFDKTLNQGFVYQCFIPSMLMAGRRVFFFNCSRLSLSSLFHEHTGMVYWYKVPCPNNNNMLIFPKSSVVIYKFLQMWLKSLKSGYILNINLHYVSL